MKEKLIELLNNAYAPYSNYQVACIIEMNDGCLIEGVNVENASYGATICAERNAITTAIAKGYKKGDFKTIHVMVNNEKIAYPCYICRQVIEEFMNGDEDLILYSKNGIVNEKIKDILVKSFNQENLK